MDDMDKPVGELVDIDPAEAARLTFLRRLVTVLTAVMIGGLLVLIVLFVTRFPTAGPKAVSFDLPDAITLPEGAAPIAFTRGSDWVAITTETEILIYDAATGDIRQTVRID
ncbi:DUF6476 family protein [Celeribacter sp.]|uniref:DUF6476 family protein n=1 Tax=Celeribacter sp. TaxID=1890673 RepID=UPI003A93F184